MAMIKRTYLIHGHGVPQEQRTWLPLSILLHCQVGKTHIDVENHTCKVIQVGKTATTPGKAQKEGPSANET